MNVLGEHFRSIVTGHLKAEDVMFRLKTQVPTYPITLPHNLENYKIAVRNDSERVCVGLGRRIRGCVTNIVMHTSIIYIVSVFNDLWFLI
jgi:hypothetical protein